jgi:hypothetical protein
MGKHSVLQLGSFLPKINSFENLVGPYLIKSKMEGAPEMLTV